MATWYVCMNRNILKFDMIEKIADFLYKEYGFEFYNLAENLEKLVIDIAENYGSSEANDPEWHKFKWKQHNNESLDVSIAVVHEWINEEITDVEIFYLVRIDK